MNTIKQDYFLQSLVKLQAVLLLEKTDVVRDSGIKRYEICYELAWKAVQELLKNQGLEVCNSPKNCFKQAFKLGLIEQEEIFANMVEGRNLTTHTYNEALADKIYLELNNYWQTLHQLAESIEVRNKL